MLIRTFKIAVYSALIAGLITMQSKTFAVVGDSAGDSLILEEQAGGRRVHRPAGTGTAPFIIKVDPKLSDSKHLVMFEEELPPGASIPRQKHPGSEEILILQTGKSRVHLGDRTRDVGPGTTVFIPQNAWISAEVIGSEPVRLKAIFSEPGFEKYMRDFSSRGRTKLCDFDGGTEFHPYTASTRG